MTFSRMEEGQKVTGAATPVYFLGLIKNIEAFQRTADCMQVFDKDKTSFLAAIHPLPQELSYKIWGIVYQLYRLDTNPKWAQFQECAEFACHSYDHIGFAEYETYVEDYVDSNEITSRGFRSMQLACYRNPLNKQTIMASGVKKYLEEKLPRPPNPSYKSEDCWDELETHLDEIEFTFETWSKTFEEYLGVEAMLGVCVDNYATNPNGYGFLLIRTGVEDSQTDSDDEDGPPEHEHCSQAVASRVHANQQTDANVASRINNAMKFLEIGPSGDDILDAFFPPGMLKDDQPHSWPQMTVFTSGHFNCM